MIKRSGFVLLSLVLSILWTAPAPTLADDSDPITIIVADCAANEFRNLKYLLKVELSASFPEVIEWIRRNHPILQIQCRNDGIAVHLRNRNNTLLNGVVLNRSESIAQDTPRYVALAAVELMAPEASDDNAIPPVEVGIIHGALQWQPAHPTVNGRWSVGALVHAGGRPYTATFGAGLYGELALPLNLSIGSNFKFSTGQENASLGQIRQILWSGAPSLLWRFQVMNWSIRPGLGLRFGQVFWKGEPKSKTQTVSNTVHAPWGGPFVTLMASRHVSKKVELSLHGELGYTILEAGALVDNTRELSISGLWYGLFLGIGTSSNRE